MSSFAKRAAILVDVVDSGFEDGELGVFGGVVTQKRPNLLYLAEDYILFLFF